MNCIILNRLAYKLRKIQSILKGIFLFKIKGLNMVKGILHSAASMLIIERKQEAIANNMANLNTTGFKKADLFQQALIDVSSKNELDWLYGGGELNLNGLKIQFKQGAFENTDNPFDVAIEGSGFFVIETPQGLRYTRNGHFTRNADSFLTTETGDSVLDENFQRIRVNGDTFQVLEDSVILNESPSDESVQAIARGGEGVPRRTKFLLVSFENLNDLIQEGNSLFKLKEAGKQPVPAQAVTLYQGRLETSNVNPLQEMVEMIKEYRIYEANQKAIQSEDATLEKAVNQVGRVG